MRASWLIEVELYGRIAAPGWPAARPQNSARMPTTKRLKIQMSKLPSATTMAHRQAALARASGTGSCVLRCSTKKNTEVDARMANKPIGSQ